MSKYLKNKISINNYLVFGSILCFIFISSLFFFILQNLTRKENIILHKEIQIKERNNNDVYLNPYTPPLRDERYLSPQIESSNSVNIRQTNFRQVGILTSISEKDKRKILPLMGRPLFSNRGKWQYYTMSDQYNSIKLQIRYKGKNALDEYGVDEIIDNHEHVFVEGLDERYKVKLYNQNDAFEYRI